MFTITKPSMESLQSDLEAAKHLPSNYSITLSTQGGRKAVSCSRGFKLDYTRSQIGHGLSAFAAAKAAMRHWQHFDIDWVRVANPEARIEPGQIVAVEAHSLGLWSLNISRILYVIDEEHRFGFGYSTTTHHVERGEERFLLEYDPSLGAVYYDLLAVSQPAHWLACLGYPYTRTRQKKFARDSHVRMTQTSVRRD